MKTQLTSLYRRLLQSGRSFARQPKAYLRTLFQAPAMLRGVAYAENWPPPAVPASLAGGEHFNPLRAYFESHDKGRGIWKWEHYFDVYHGYFAKFAGRNVNLLEIGIYSGGSLAMWRDYLGPGCRVFGVDIQEACLAYQDERTSVSIGDQADRTFWRRFKDRNPVMDIVIDDGGHLLEQQIVTLEEMLPHLAPGGVYVCEDIHTSQNEFTSYLHGLVTRLNAKSGPEPSRVTASSFQRWIKAIHFYPYMVVIEKSETSQETLASPKKGTEWEPFL